MADENVRTTEEVRVEDSGRKKKTSVEEVRTEKPKTKEELEEETVRLRARVRQLEDELDAAEGERPRRRRAELDDEDEERNWDTRVRRTTRRASTQGSRLLRGLVLSYLDGVRMAAEIVTDFADDVIERNRPTRERVRGRDRYESRERRDVYDDEYEDSEDQGEGRHHLKREYEQRDGRVEERETRDQQTPDGGRFREERHARRDVRDSDRDRGRVRGRVRARRRRTSSGDDLSEPEALSRELPRDIYSSALDALDRGADIPDRMVDRFYDSFKETDR